MYRFQIAHTSNHCNTVVIPAKAGIQAGLFKADFRNGLVALLRVAILRILRIGSILGKIQGAKWRISGGNDPMDAL
jgi:hypothetical protein